MVADDAADGGTRDRMMTGNMSGDRTDGGPFQTALGLHEARQGHGGRAYDQNR